MRRLLFFVFIFGLIHGNFALVDSNLPDKDNVKEYLMEQMMKNGMVAEKYNGAIYDDANIVVIDDPVVDDKSAEDEPRMFDFRIPEAAKFNPRAKRDIGGSAGPEIDAKTGLTLVKVDSTDGLVPYDAHIDPDFPKAAPVARGLYNVPEGWNLDKTIDMEFKTGYRKALPGQNPSYSASSQSRSPGVGFQSSPALTQVGTQTIEGPYIMTSSGLVPLSTLGSYSGPSATNAAGYSGAGYGSSYSGYGSSNGGYGSGYGGYGSSYGGSGSGYGGYGSGYGSNYGGYNSGYGSSGYGGYGSNYGGNYGSGYGGNYQGYLQQAAMANLGVGYPGIWG
uniref:Uncharacterized protein n=1 Tax=Panagrolaimus sp. JU765 TaxID=591449 RepID=A0AC34QWX0_9BILA